MRILYSRPPAIIIAFLFSITMAKGQPPVFSLLENEKPLPAALNSYVSKGSVYKLYQNKVEELFAAKPAACQLKFHFENQDWIIDLKKADFLSKGFFVRNASNENVDYRSDNILHYKGKIHNRTNSFAAISILHDEIIAVLADEKSNINIGALKNPAFIANDQHIIYRESDIKIINPFECFATDGTNASESPLPLAQTPVSTSAIINAEPVDIYFEADNKCYSNNGSNITNTVNWATALFNVVTTLYENDSILTKMSAIKVWNIADPYVALTTTSTVLSAFSSNMSTGFPGDLAHFLSQRGLGGGIAWLNVLCSGAYNRTAVSGSLSNSFSPLPTYSWNSMVVTHETGHNIASNHTQWCGWPGGAIDNCYTTEGGCAQGPAPVNGGTIMSYCHLTSYGINLSNGFGPLPGAAIRNAVRTSTCIYPRITFNTTLQTATEEDADSNNNCLDYKMVNFRLGLNYNPTQPAVINLLPSGISSPGLSIGNDKDVSISPMNFSLIDTTAQIIQLKVYDDPFIENKEILKLDYSIAANGTNAVKSGTAQLDILSLDHKPDSTVNQILFYEPFDNIASGLGGWTQTAVYGATSPNRWIVNTNVDSQFVSKAACISFNGSTAGYAGSNAGDSSIIRLESPTINAAGFINMRLSYSYKCNGEASGVGQGTTTPLDYGKVYYSINNGVTWAVLRESFSGRPFKLNDEVLIPAAANNSPALKIAYEWRNNSSVVNNPPFIIDSIVVKGTGSCDIQTNTHIANSQEAYLGPNQTVHFYNPVTKNIMATIANKSSHDFGCTTVDILKTGTGAFTSWGDYDAQKIADKCYKITATNDNPAASYDLSLYYTADEVNGWAAATGNSVADISIVKTIADITQPQPATAAIFSNYNSALNYKTADKLFTGNFTGSSYFSVGKPGISAVCPGATQQLSANEASTSYQWQVNTGSGYLNIANGPVYSDATTATLVISAAPTSFYGYKYRCLITDVQGAHYSIEYSLKFAIDWIGSADTNWENIANWSCSKTPDANTDVFIKANAAFYPSVNSNATIRSLKVQNGTTVNVKSGVQLLILK